MNYRPLRPYFYKPVAPMGVPLKFWAITLGATIFSAIFLFMTVRQIFGLPSFVYAAAVAVGLTSFFLWAHNKRKRGYLYYAPQYLAMKILGIGNNLTAERPGKQKLKWIKDADNRFPEWMNE